METKISWNIGGSPMVGHLPVVRCLPTVACSGKVKIQNILEMSYQCYCGYCEEVPEKYIDSFTAFSGSGVAFMGMALEAMADGGVLVGIPRSMADKIAAYTMISAAKMVLKEGLQPSEIKSLVASPGGTTIHGLKVMEDCGVRSGIMGAVQRATERAIELRPKQT
ncbi:LOW QUALITY PROTEIN: pyrroline-5-carboxylate reductase 3-like [Gigantopelta aegis]|uniref:LOW QUALITY PROTEIN: pyrroline-5-carboxylate reductase 3-like n=1 Tax=Gigantopelta aegis TaxID=1735272 RepID=UPI001B88D896|nr:LOW QUALITY PROTEIN: pyrroline-5-carboxylate reductase 3-like [Gigantopelta aegis]